MSKKNNPEESEIYLYLKETAKEYTEKHNKRLKEFLDEFEADEIDYIEKEIEYFENTLYDVQNSEGSHDGYSTTGFKNFSSAYKLATDIGYDKFMYSTNSKLKFLASQIVVDTPFQNQQSNNNQHQKIIITPQTDINEYLADSNNITIYESLTTEKHKHLFEPLAFFNNLYTELNFYRTNSHNYLAIKNHFEKPLFYNEYQNLYFYIELRLLILVDFEKNKPSEIQEQTSLIVQRLAFSTALFIQNKFDRKSTNEDLHIPEDSIISFYAFDVVTDHLKTLPDNHERLKYLLNKKTKFLNNHQEISTIGISFDKKCDNEMNKIKELIALEEPQQTDKLNSNSVPFKVLLLFAENKIYSKVITNGNIKTTMYYYLEQEFENTTQLAKHLNLSRQYINDTFKGNDTRHNLYKSKVNMINVFNHCKENNISAHESFTKKYCYLMKNQS